MREVDSTFLKKKQGVRTLRVRERGVKREYVGSTLRVIERGVESTLVVIRVHGDNLKSVRDVGSMPLGISKMEYRIRGEYLKSE